MEQILNNEKIDNYETMVSVISECRKFGNLISLSFSAEDEDNEYVYYKVFDNYEDFIKLYSAKEYDKANEVIALYVNDAFKTTLVSIYKDSKLIVVASKNEKENSNVSYEQSKYESFMDDDDCTYYKFALGVFAKYDPNKELYYSLDQNNNWVLDNRILPWIIGADYDYVEVKKNKTEGVKK